MMATTSVRDEASREKAVGEVSGAMSSYQRLIWLTLATAAVGLQKGDGLCAGKRGGTLQTIQSASITKYGFPKGQATYRQRIKPGQNVQVGQTNCQSLFERSHGSSDLFALEV